MDIYQRNFWVTLPTVLKAIAEATYVAIDLEMTGIKSKPNTKSSEWDAEEVYRQAKASATGFHILQFGLTCVRYNMSVNIHNAQSFTFHITPMFIENNSVELLLAKVVDRSVSFSYSSLLFLKSHGFQLEKAFKDGVCYLSRMEAVEVNPILLHNDSARVFIHPVDIEAQDRETKEFYSSTRTKVSRWLEGPRAENFVNISNPHGGRLNRLQIGLVHQLLQIEFPTCRGFARCGNAFLQIMRLDTKREQDIWNRKLKERKAAVARQSGFRFVVEALTGGRFAEDIIPECLAATGSKAGLNTMTFQLAQDMNRYEATLRAEQPILVGHNQFYDLCFIYQAFIGQLPPSQEAFRQEIHRLFPRMVDTKHLASRGGHSMVGDDSLGELYASLKDEPNPLLIQDTLLKFGKGTAHQAGYDSWMTSLVFAKLSWKLSQDPANWIAPPGRACPEEQVTNPQSVAKSDDKSSPPAARPSTPESEEDTLHPAFASFNPFAVLGKTGNQSKPSQQQGQSQPTAPHSPEQPSRTKAKPAGGTGAAAKPRRVRASVPAPIFPRRVVTAPPAPGRGAHLTGSWRLPAGPTNDSPAMSGLPNRTRPRRSRPRKKAARPVDRVTLLDGDDNDGDNEGHRQRINKQWRALEPTPVPAQRPVPRTGKPPSGGDAEIPGWDTGFWQKYGNKLRLGGAGVLDLA